MKKQFLLTILIFNAAILFSQTTTSEYSEQLLTSQEAWNMGDQIYHIEGTGVLEGKIFIVRALWDKMPSEEDYDDALKIAQFALVKGYRNNAKNLRFYNQFAEVSMEHIGVALIYKNGMESQGYRFMFDSKDVLGDKFSEGVIPLPKELNTDISIKSLGSTYWNYIVDDRGDKIYDQFDSGLKQQYTEEQFLQSFPNIVSYAKKLNLSDFSHSIFVGRGLGGRFFKYFYWVENETSNGFMTLTILDKNNTISIVGLDINANSFFKR